MSWMDGLGLTDSPLLRLLLAFACGVCIGLNRDLHRKSAGFRTFGLVSVGSALVTLAAVQAAGADFNGVSRVIQGVLTGIGFLGAGVIFHRESSRRVAGLTTAAAIWLTSALGVTCGLGNYRLAISAVALALLILVVGGPIERRFERLVRRDVSRERALPSANDPGPSP